MSDQPTPEEQETPSGAFGKLNVNDELVEIIRHPANQHLDEKQQNQSEPPPA